MCCLACQAGRRQAMHSLYLGTVAPTCSLACTRTSELMSSTDWQGCALRIVARVPRPAAYSCAMHCAEVHDTM